MKSIQVDNVGEEGKIQGERDREREIRGVRESNTVVRENSAG
jgi:hypothetical protein